VGGKAANGLGFHDMIGNAWEVVGDWYADYTRQAQVDPVGPATGRQRILRGSYFDFDGGFCRASLRYPATLVERVSFRAARTP
jgi:formylglycine-generating enzyme required for sulfatase activity